MISAASAPRTRSAATRHPAASTRIRSVSTFSHSIPDVTRNNPINSGGRCSAAIG
jgi:hypothetical protein